MSDPQVLQILWLHAVQVSILALAVWAVVRWFAQNRPHLAHLLWALVLLKCLTPPIFASPTSPFSWLAGLSDTSLASSEKFNISFTENKPRTIESQTDKNAETTERGSELRASGNSPEHDSGREGDRTKTQENFSAFAWLLGKISTHPWGLSWFFTSVFFGCILLSRFIIFIRRLSLLVQNQDPEIAHLSDELQPVANHLCKRLGIQRRVKVTVVDALIGPAILGLWRPTILVPRLLVSDASKQQLKALIGHELVHFRRGDLWWSTIQAMATCLVWWNPLAWIASKQFQQETERCCDEETVASLGIEPSTYAHVLVGVLEKKSTLKAAPLLPGVRPVEITAKRLERIMRFGQGCRSRGPRWAMPLLLLGCCIVLPGAALSIAQETPNPILPSYPGLTVPRTANQTPNVVANPLVEPSEELKTGLNQSSTKSSELLIRQYPVADALALISQAENVTENRAKQLLLNSLPPAAPSATHAKFHTTDPHTGQQLQVQLGGDEPNRKFEGNYLFELTTNAKHEEVAKSLRHIAQYGVSMLALEVKIFELPVQTMETLTVNWKEHSRSSSKVVPASFDNSVSETVAFRNAVLNAETVEALKSSGELISAPQIMLLNGNTGTLEIGTQHPFVTSYEVIEDQSGNQFAQPKITTLQSGLAMGFTATLQSSGTVQLQISYQDSEVGRVDTFTLPIAGREVSIQQPSFSSTGFSITETIPLDAPFAVTGKNKTREFRVERSVPILGSIPYVNKLFKNVGVGREEVSTILVLECKKVDRSGDAKLMNSNPEVNATSPALAEPVSTFTSPRSVTSDLGLEGRLLPPAPSKISPGRNRIENEEKFSPSPDSTENEEGVE